MIDTEKISDEKIAHYVLLQASLIQFMALLQDDVKLHLDGTTDISVDKMTPFIAKMDISIGVRPQDDLKMKEYHPRLTKLLGSIPNMVKPVPVGKAGIFAVEDTKKVTKDKPRETKYVEENDL